MGTYSAHHLQNIEDFVIRWGSEIPKDRRQEFVDQLAEIVKVTGAEAVEDFMERFKNYGELNGI
jgi:hypothetical protein